MIQAGENPDKFRTLSQGRDCRLDNADTDKQHAKAHDNGANVFIRGFLDKQEYDYSCSQQYIEEHR